MYIYALVALGFLYNSEATFVKGNVADPHAHFTRIGLLAAQTQMLRLETEGAMAFLSISIRMSLLTSNCVQ